MSLTLLVELAKRYWWLALALVAFGIGWWAHSISAKPVDARTVELMDSLRATREAYNRASTARANLLRDLANADSALKRREDAVNRVAERGRVASERLRAQADELGRQLQYAQTAADSVPVLVAQLNRLEESLDSAYGALDSAATRYSIAQERLEGLRRSNLVAYQQRIEDSTRIAVQETVIEGLRKAKTACSRWCPTGILTYDVRNSGVSVGAGVRPRSWLTIGAEYRLGG